MDFKNKVVIITGASRGLGQEYARQFARHGAHVVACDLRSCDETLRIIKDEGAEGLALTTDVTSESSTFEMAAAASDRFDAIDILVNNAGGQFPQKARDFTPNGWRSVIDLNLNGTWNMTQAFGNKMLEGVGGSICQIIATVGRGIPGIAHSASARAGVLELSRTLAFEWGPKVRVNCVAPGQFRTEAFDSTYEDGVGDGFVEQPLPNIGDVRDIANGVIFLVSPGARFITGEVLYVDGGLILQGPMSALPADGYPERE